MTVATQREIAEKLKEKKAALAEKNGVRAEPQAAGRRPEGDPWAERRQSHRRHHVPSGMRYNSPQPRFGRPIPVARKTMPRVMSEVAMKARHAMGNR